MLDIPRNEYTHYTGSLCSRRLTGYLGDHSFITNCSSQGFARGLPGRICQWRGRALRRLRGRWRAELNVSCVHKLIQTFLCQFSIGGDRGYLEQNRTRKNDSRVQKNWLLIDCEFGLVKNRRIALQPRSFSKQSLGLVWRAAQDLLRSTACFEAIRKVDRGVFFKRLGVGIERGAAGRDDSHAFCVCTGKRLAGECPDGGIWTDNHIPFSLLGRRRCDSG